MYQYQLERLKELGPVIATVLGVVTIAWIIIVYIIRSRTLYGIAKRRGISICGMAWVPVLFVWTLGGIADKYDGDHGMKRSWRWVMLILAMLSMAAYVAFCVFIIKMMKLQGSISAMANINTHAIMDVFVPMYVYMFALMLVLSACISCAGICYYKLFESCKPKAAVRMLLLSLLVSFAAPFCLLSCLKWEAGVKCSVVVKRDDPCTEVIGETATDGEKTSYWEYEEFNIDPGDSKTQE